MKIEQRIFKNQQWDSELPELDNKPVLAFAFGAPEYGESTQPFDDLGLGLVGCSGDSKSQISEEQSQLITDTKSTITKCEYSEDQNGWISEAEFTNTTGEQIDSLVISIDFLDKDKNVLGFSKAELSDINPDQEVLGTTLLASKEDDVPGIVPLEEEAEVTSCIVSKLTIAETSG